MSPSKCPAGAVAAGDGDGNQPWFSWFSRLCSWATLVAPLVLLRTRPQWHLWIPLSPLCRPHAPALPVRSQWVSWPSDSFPSRLPPTLMFSAAFPQCQSRTRSPSESRALKAPVTATHSSSWLDSSLSSIPSIQKSRAPA